MLSHLQGPTMLKLDTVSRLIFASINVRDFAKIVFLRQFFCESPPTFPKKKTFLNL